MFIIRHSDSSKLNVDIHGIDLSIVNSLRRIILSEIPNVAIPFDPITNNNPHTEIFKNTSALHNEALMQRISLIPVCFDEDMIKYHHTDDYTFKLAVKNNGTDIIHVTTADIVISDKYGIQLSEEQHQKIFPTNPITKDHILIIKLKPNPYSVTLGDEIDIEFKVTKNVAKTHARWCPVSQCCFENIIDEAKADQKLKEALEAISGEKEKQAYIKRFNTLDKYRYFVVDKYNEACAFTFKVESECALKPFNIFNQSISILCEKVKKFKDNLVNQTSVTTKQMPQVDGMFEILILDEDYTLLNVLQSCVYNETIRKGKSIFQGINLEYIGYYQPHPLDPKMILKVKFTSGAISIEDVNYCMANQCDIITNTLENMQEQWYELAK